MRAMVWLCAAMVAGCSGVSGPQAQVNQYNLVQEKQYSPMRAQYKAGKGGAFSMEMGLWAGEVGSTAANAHYQQAIFDAFEKNCGLARADLREVRVVRHAPPTEWYEVWVFNDQASRRFDKASGMSVVMRFDPATNRTNVSFQGNCRA